MKEKAGNSGRRENRLVRKTGLKRTSRMEVGEEVVSKKRLDQRKCMLVLQLLRSSEFLDMPQSV